MRFLALAQYCGQAIVDQLDIPINAHYAIQRLHVSVCHVPHLHMVQR
jgi:hypothetical protein